MSERGIVLALTDEQRIDRARRMCNHPGTAWFTKDLPSAPEGYYRLRYPNGGHDPTAPHPFHRWRWADPRNRVSYDIDDRGNFLTADCVGFASWASGFDRKQSLRGSHFQGGSINCDFMVTDALRWRRCFHRLDRPSPGCLVVYPSLADQDDDGERDGAGHVGVVVGYWVTTRLSRLCQWGHAIPEWDPNELQCWLDLAVVDCVNRFPHLAIQLGTGRAWFGARKGEAGISVPKRSLFVRSAMEP